MTDKPITLNLSNMPLVDLEKIVLGVGTGLLGCMKKKRKLALEELKRRQEIGLLDQLYQIPNSEDIKTE